MCILYKKVILIFSFILGPKLPFRLKGSTMIPSPTGKGILMIGGYKYKIRASVGIASSDILELSGDSKKKLRWKFLQQKLQYPRSDHITFPISNDIAKSIVNQTSASACRQCHSLLD